MFKDKQIVHNNIFTSQNIDGKPIEINHKNSFDGLLFLKHIKECVVSCVFFDPQYRGVLDKLRYGNEGKRQIARAKLSQMSEETIHSFLEEIARVLRPSGHLFFWIDKFHLCEGVKQYVPENMQIVDLITWNKERLGMGYRTRRCCEYLLVLQKKPIRAKDIWLKHDIRDCVSEKITDKVHTHQKPHFLQKSLIESVTKEQDIVLDPCAGSFSIMKACLELKRNFLGTDILFGNQD